MVSCFFVFKFLIQIPGSVEVVCLNCYSTPFLSQLPSWSGLDAEGEGSLHLPLLVLVGFRDHTRSGAAVWPRLLCEVSRAMLFMGWEGGLRRNCWVWGKKRTYCSLSWRHLSLADGGSAEASTQGLPVREFGEMRQGGQLLRDVQGWGRWPDAGDATLSDKGRL